MNYGCPFDKQFDALRKYWMFSEDNLKKITAAISDIDAPNSTVLVAGSYGRMEAGVSSDLDFFVVSKTQDTNALIKKVQDEAKKLNIPLPNSKGVFSKHLDYKRILDDLGSSEETISELAQRLLPLIETRPLFNPEVYEEIRNEILAKYMILHRDSPKKEAAILLNDLMRYFRHICSNFQFSMWREGEKWALRNIKLRHSRIVMYAGLLFVIMNASKEIHLSDKEEYIRKMLPLTPVERIATIMKENEFDASEFLNAYNNYLALINEKDIRDRLRTAEYSNRHNHKEFGELSANSSKITKEFMDFTFKMRGIWSDQAFTYLIF